MDNEMFGRLSAFFMNVLYQIHHAQHRLSMSRHKPVLADFEQSKMKLDDALVKRHNWALAPDTPLTHPTHPTHLTHLTHPTHPTHPTHLTHLLNYLNPPLFAAHSVFQPAPARASPPCSPTPPRQYLHLRVPVPAEYVLCQYTGVSKASLRQLPAL
jgi:hypothetical protein